MSRSLSVLIVEDSENDAELVLRELRRCGYEPIYERVETPEAMGSALDRQTWDIIISDCNMPRFSSPSALALLKERGLDIPFIIVSGTIDEETTIAVIKAGANDYLLKNNLGRLIPVIEREIKEAKVRKECKSIKEAMNHMAYYDLLTNLPNRLMLHDSIERAINNAKNDNRPCALLIMDLNQFREINDTLGHQNGDLILQQIGPRIQEVLRETDMIARLGGDEFAILLPNSDVEAATKVTDKIIRRLEEPFILGEIPLNVSASIGISLFPGHGEDTHTLIRRADIAMYLAKNRDRGFCLYSPKYDRHSPDRLRLMGELYHAIEQDQLFLVYQPKIDLKTSRPIGVEALVRWQHPRLGIIPPGKFIDLAEHTGLIKQVTFWVLKEALRHSKGWYKAGLETSISVNLSVKSLQAPQLLDQIKGLLSTWGVAPNRLRLEITEGIIMTDPEYAIRIITQLTAMGILFSIDDFGTGYSSLGYLKRLPVDEIKIDKSFVINMMNDENDAMIVRSIIELSHNLSLKVTAEGVENKEIFDKLTSLGCDHAQGYFISHPISQAELIGWLNKEIIKVRTMN